MKQVRNGVFETNSSSVHAISIDSSGREPSQFQLNEHGKIEISFGSFGRESRTYYSQYNKLSYLMTLRKSLRSSLNNNVSFISFN